MTAQFAGTSTEIVLCPSEVVHRFYWSGGFLTCSPSLGHPVGGFSGFQVHDG